MNLSEKKLQELKDKKISIEDSNNKYFYTTKDGVNIDTISKLLNENICSFKEIVEKFKSIKNKDFDPCLYRLLDDNQLFEEFVQNNLLTKDDLKYLLNTTDKGYEVLSLSENISLLIYIVDKGLFKELVDTFKSIKDFRNKPYLYKLLANKELFENNKLTKDDTRYLLNKIDNDDELRGLCHNTSLIKHILNEFILDRGNVDKFNEIIGNDDWLKDHNIYTIFEVIEYRNKNNEEILNLNELNKKICLLNNFDLTENQKLEIHEILRNNEIARNRLIQIIDNHLEDQYDFENLKNLLTKDDKKKKIKMNF